MSPSRNNSIIIFDWDDTICPSSFVDRAGVDNYKKLPKRCHNLFTEIEKCTEKCLAEAAKYGEVIIITNSDEGWVKYSAERYLPGLLPILKNYRIVSARTRYEKFYPNQPLCWKAAAFAHEANEHFCEVEDAAALLDRECANTNNNIKGDLPEMDLVSTDDSSMGSLSSTESPEWNNGHHSHHHHPSSNHLIKHEVCPMITYKQREIISFGDSMEERTAVKIVSDQLSSTPKSVMFLSNPTPTQIIGQLSMLTRHMGFVCENARDLDLEISSRQAEKCAQSYLSECESSSSMQVSRNGTTTYSGRESSGHSSILQRILRAGSACTSHDEEME